MYFLGFSSSLKKYIFGHRNYTKHYMHRLQTTVQKKCIREVKHLFVICVNESLIRCFLY